MDDFQSALYPQETPEQKKLREWAEMLNAIEDGGPAKAPPGIMPPVAPSPSPYQPNPDFQTRIPAQRPMAPEPKEDLSSVAIQRDEFGPSGGKTLANALPGTVGKDKNDLNTLLADWEDVQNRKKQKMRGMRDMTEGLSSIGSGLANVMAKRAGWQPTAEPLMAEDARGELDTIDDQMSPADLDAYARMGISMPPGMTYSKMKQVSPILAQQSQMGYRQDALAQRKEEEKRRVMGMERIPWKQETQLRGYQKTDADLADVEQLFDEGLVTSGPVAGRLAELGKKWGVLDPDNTIARMRMTAVLAEYVRSISGAQVAYQEYDRLVQAIPNMATQPEVFKRALQDYRAVIKRDYDRMLNSAKGMHYETDYLDKYAPSGGTNPSLGLDNRGGAVGGVTMIKPDGEIVPGIDDVEGFMADFPGSKPQG